MSLDLHPQLLRALDAVLATGSLTAASERLGYTQSALSKQVAALEAAVGTRLFQRGPRGVEPTEAAHRLARRATVVLDQLDAAERELADLDAPLQGRVALGGFATAAMHLVPRALARCRRRHPDVEVDFVELSTPVQVRRLRSGRLDLALLATGSGLDWDLTGIAHEPLLSGRLLVAVADDHPLARARRVHVDELRDERWVAADGTRGDPQFGVWPTIDDPRIAVTLAGWSSRLGFVAAGLGITTIPSLAARALPPGVATVEVEDPAWAGRTTLLAHVGALSTSAAAVRDALLGEAESVPSG